MNPTGGYNGALADARRARRLTQGQLAERVSARLGTDPPLDGNYISKLERGVHTWPNINYRRAFREELGTKTDAELGFHCNRSVSEKDDPGSADATDWAEHDRVLAASWDHQGTVEAAVVLSVVMTQWSVGISVSWRVRPSLSRRTNG